MYELRISDENEHENPEFTNEIFLFLKELKQLTEISLLFINQGYQVSIRQKE